MLDDVLVRLKVDFWIEQLWIRVEPLLVGLVARQTVIDHGHFPSPASGSPPSLASRQPFEALPMRRRKFTQITCAPFDKQRKNAIDRIVGPNLLELRDRALEVTTEVRVHRRV